MKKKNIHGYVIFQSENPNGGADVAEILSSDEGEDYYEEEEDDYYVEEEEDDDDENDIRVSFKVLQKLIIENFRNYAYFAVKV